MLKRFNHVTLFSPSLLTRAKRSQTCHVPDSLNIFFHISICHITHSFCGLLPAKSGLLRSSHQTIWPRFQQGKSQAPGSGTNSTFREKDNCRPPVYGMRTRKHLWGRAFFFLYSHLCLRDGMMAQVVGSVRELISDAVATQA